MPSITPIEVAVVTAGMVILYVIPFLLAVADGRRRRREQAWQAMIGSSESAVSAEAPLSVTPDVANDSTETPVAVALEPTETEPQRPLTEPETLPPADWDVPVPLAEPASAVYEPQAPEPPLPAPESALEADGNGTHDHDFEPFEGNGGYSFRLEDLHRVRLADVTDQAGNPILPEAERLLGAQRSTVISMPLASPYPIQSACLATVDRNTAGLRLCYLLFPSLWPASRNEAVAEAVFEIDTVAGTVTHRLGIRSAADLDETVRRAVRENSGQV